MTASQHGTGSSPLRPDAAPSSFGRDELERESFLRRLFDDTALHYERIESILAFGTGRWYRRSALRRAGLRPGDHVLDVGIGTGLLAREALQLIQPRGQLVGVDPSLGMMGQVGLSDVKLVHGRAERLARPDASADFLCMGYALRHLTDLATALREFHRVLRPGGRLLLLEVTQPQGPWARRLLKTHVARIAPAVALLVSRSRNQAQLWRYHWDTIEAGLPPDVVLEALRQAGFDRVGRHVELGVFSEYTAVKAESPTP